MFRKFIGVVLGLVALSVATVASAQSSYRLRPGDTLQIEVLEDSSLNRSTLVLPDGSISFPHVGTIPAAGLSVSDVRAALTSGLRPIFTNEPNVFVSVGTLAEAAAPVAAAVSEDPVIAIYALGEVTAPGKKEVAPGTTLLQFLAESGGLTRFAATKRIQLRRVDAAGQEQVYTFNYNAVQAGARSGGNTVLQAGDVVLVPERKLFE